MGIANLVGKESVGMAAGVVGMFGMVGGGGCRQGIGWLATQEAIKAIRIRSLAPPNYHALQPEQAVDEIY